MHDLEIGGVELQPNYGPDQAGDFGGANCFDSNLKTACRPNTASEKSAISLELNGPCFETTKTCPQFDIKSITIYTPTVNVPGYQAGNHKIKVSLRTSSKKGKLASACLWCWTIVSFSVHHQQVSPTKCVESQNNSPVLICAYQSSSGDRIFHFWEKWCWWQSIGRIHWRYATGPKVWHHIWFWIPARKVDHNFGWSGPFISDSGWNTGLWK